MSVLLYTILSVNNFGLDSIIKPKPNYLVDGVHGFIGGVVGFGATAYLTNFLLTKTNYGSKNFSVECCYVFGYTLGMPICASSFIHFNPLNENRSKKSFVRAIKNSFIGAQLGLCAILIASHISQDTKYWTGLFIFPFPIIGAIIGHNSLPLEIKDYNNKENKDTLMKTDNPKIFLKIFCIDLK